MHHQFQTQTKFFRTSKEGEGQPATAARTDHGKGKVQPDGGKVYQGPPGPASHSIRRVPSPIKAFHGA